MPPPRVPDPLKPRLQGVVHVLHAGTERAKHTHIITTSAQEADNVIQDQVRKLVKRYTVKGLD